MAAIKQAIIPLAGRGTRMYPASTVLPKGLIPLIDTDGIAKAAIQLIVEECARSGIEQVILVVSPNTEDAYRRYFAPISDEDLPAFTGKTKALEQSERLAELSKKIIYVTQEAPLGFGHAVYCASDYVKGAPFAVLLGDHAHLSNTDQPCLQQTLEVFNQHQQSVFAVHPVPESVVGRFGIIGGKLISDRTYKVERIIEKPTIEQAREHLKAESIPDGHYLAHFGIYLFNSETLQILETMVKNHQSGEVQLTDAQIKLLEQQECLAYFPNGSSHDFGVPEGLLETQHALALRSPLAYSIQS